MYIYIYIASTKINKWSRHVFVSTPYINLSPFIVQTFILLDQILVCIYIYINVKFLFKDSSMDSMIHLQVVSPSFPNGIQGLGLLGSSAVRAEGRPWFWWKVVKVAKVKVDEAVLEAGNKPTNRGSRGRCWLVVGWWWKGWWKRWKVYIITNVWLQTGLFWLFLLWSMGESWCLLFDIPDSFDERLGMLFPCKTAWLERA